MESIINTIRLINALDVASVEDGRIKREQIRFAETNMMVNANYPMTCINESMQTILQLPLIARRTYRVSGKVLQDIDQVGPLRIEYKKQINICSAIIIPGLITSVLGNIAMLGMNMFFDEKRKEFIINPYTRI